MKWMTSISTASKERGCVRMIYLGWESKCTKRIPGRTKKGGWRERKRIESSRLRIREEDRADNSILKKFCGVMGFCC